MLHNGSQSWAASVMNMGIDLSGISAVLFQSQFSVYKVLGQNSEDIQVLNLERKCAMSVYLSTLWV